MNIKKKAHEQGAMPIVRDGEIWWAAVGENVGVEINGKNAPFSRPVLVLKRLGMESFLAVPLTSKRHSGTWYVDVIAKNKRQCMVLSQIRVMSVRRLYEQLGEISDGDLKRVKAGLRALYCE